MSDRKREYIPVQPQRDVDRLYAALRSECREWKGGVMGSPEERIAAESAVRIFMELDTLIRATGELPTAWQREEGQ